MCFAPRILLAVLFLIMSTSLAEAQQSDEAALPSTIAPPTAKLEPVELTTHGHTRIDPYFWMRERENPEVIAYLEAENAYTEALTSHTKDVQEELFEEIKSRIKQDDSTVPYRYGDYFYYERYEEGRQYPIYARKQGSLHADEEVLLDANDLAEGRVFLSVTDEISPKHDILAYAADTVGRRIYTIYFKDLTTGDLLPDVIPNVTGNLEWANDG